MIAPVFALLQASVPQLAVTEPPEHFAPWLVFTIVKILAIFTIYLLGVAYLTLLERRIAAWVQDRRGPNRVGPHGLGQPLADGLKNIMKEETYPRAAYKPLFVLAPALSFIPALMTLAVIPFASPWHSRYGMIEMAIAPLPIGFLYILAIASLGVYGIVLAGWASNSKYALLGGLRSSAQMVSYEIAMGMSTIPVLLLAGNVALKDVIAQQQHTGWNVVLITISFFVFLVAAFAETNRLPFDLPEAESELVAGYHTEYSGMKFSMFFIAEYSNMVTASALMATLFFGGWDIPFTHWDDTGPFTKWKTLATFVAFFIKTFFFIFLYMWVRWTLPRFRYDQLMSLGWKVLLPIALAYVMIIAGAILGLQALGHHDDIVFSLTLLAINIVLVILLFVVADRGRVVSPAYGRMSARQLAALRARSTTPLSTLTEAGD
jgi:NADH-quinone oxidoreductase subunit H